MFDGWSTIIACCINREVQVAANDVIALYYCVSSEFFCIQYDTARCFVHHHISLYAQTGALVQCPHAALSASDGPLVD